MHMKLLTVSALAATVAAFPAVQSEARALSSSSETNSGFFPSKQFDAQDQYVDVSPGSGHEFRSPTKHQIRGPCPGLNAAANHGFTSRTGVFDYQDTTQGLFDAFALGKDFSNILFVFSIFNSGSLVDMKWSIGGPMKTTTVGGLLGKGLGLSNSHNKYEGDSSPARGDAYLHHGDAHSLVIGNYANIIKHAGKKDNYDFASMRKHIVYTHEYTIKNNPYGFFGPGFFVSPIAHEFVTAFMSNHSADNVGGTLPKSILNSFFAVKEDKNGKMTWMPGQDRIPDNWYRRPSNNPYGVAAAFGDLGLTIKENPEIADIGGNMGKPNSYAGIEIEDLTGGVFNSKNLLKGNNLACFAVQGLTIAIPGATSALQKKATPFAKMADKILGGQLAALNCPQIKKYDTAKFKKYPGWQWDQPIQPATPY